MKHFLITLTAVLILMGCAKDTARVSEIYPVREYITVSFSGKPEFQPHRADNPSMGFCLGAVYDPLWKQEEDGSVVPVLGKEIVNRGKEADIYLKEGIEWHDGSSFTSADVVYTISLITSGQSVYPKGIIEGAKISDNNSVTVFFSAEFWEPERLFTFPIIKNGTPLSLKEPVGTGMYKFKGKGGFDTYLFEPFTNKSLPPLRMIGVKDKVRETELFKCGITDIQFVDSRDISDYIPLADSQSIKYPTKHITYIGFNTYTLSPNFRRAVFYALDTSHIAGKIYGSRAKATAVPYLSQSSFLYKHIKSLPMARSELSAGGFRWVDESLFFENKKVNVQVGVTQGDGHREIAYAVAEGLTEIGVQCVLEDFDNKNSYDIVILSENFTGEALTAYFEKNPCLTGCTKSQVEFNNVFFREIPFIPIAFKCNGVFFSNEYDSKFGVKFPLFFGKSGNLN